MGVSSPHPGQETAERRKSRMSKRRKGKKKHWTHTGNVYANSQMSVRIRQKPEKVRSLWR